MQSMETGVANMLADFGPELAAALRSAQNNDKFAQSVRKTWSDNPDVADFLLAHTNVIFFEKDQAPRKGSAGGKDRFDLCVYVDDSLANSELNARRELLVLMLAQEGILFQNLNIRFATRGTKERHLFPEVIDKLGRGAQNRREEVRPSRGETASDQDIAELAAKIDDPRLAERFKTAMTTTVGNPAATPDPTNSWIGREGTDYQVRDESRLLEILKRAFCQAFDDFEQAGAVLERIEGASLDEVSTSRYARSSITRYRCHLYTSCPEELGTVLAAHGGTVIACAKGLKLYLTGISVHRSPDPVKGRRAFPRSGHPVPMRAYRLQPGHGTHNQG